jgi:hypothetical protein
MQTSAAGIGVYATGGPQGCAGLFGGDRKITGPGTAIDFSLAIPDGCP